MNILSWSYACFMAGVFAIHWIVPVRFRWATLLVSSASFVCLVAPEALCLLVFMVMLSYSVACLMRKLGAANRMATLLFQMAVLLAVASLAFFKYGAFFREFVVILAKAFGQTAGTKTGNRFLPIGISFWTFSILSYMFDVRAGRIQAETHLGRYAAYVLFFPKFLSGPIDRASSFLPQLLLPNPFSYSRAVRGMRQIALGLFRKLVVADMLAAYTDKAFGNPSRFCSMTLVICAVFYSLQIYNDFAGYSDIAIGSARLLGIDLADNFRAPCFAKSLKEFWSRWHISLSTWFRDYFYIPLGGSKCGVWRTRFNLFATFVVSGLWHGANLTFVAWGAIHGLFQIVEKCLWANKRKNGESVSKKGFFEYASSSFRWCVTFAVVTVAWVFFRADNISVAWAYISKMSLAWHSPLYGFSMAFDQLHINLGTALQIGLPIGFLAVWDGFSLVRDPFDAFNRLQGWVRWLAYAALLSALLFILLPQGESSQNFIYYNF